jgi:glutamine cyclotransferase
LRSGCGSSTGPLERNRFASVKTPVNATIGPTARRIIYVAVAALALVLVLLVGKGIIPRSLLRLTEAPVYGYRIVNEYPHDPGAFTQGLFYENGFLYEGTGRRGHSSLRKVDLSTGEVLKIKPLSDRLFGEGIAGWDGRIVQLTLRAKKGFVYAESTFEIEREFTYSTQGWGITYDGKDFIMSDGTSALYSLEPGSFTRVGQVIVKDGHRAVMGLNELEYIKGEIYANVWRTDLIARISPATGKVTGWIGLTGLLSAEDRSDTTDVLNGIAYDAEHDRLFVTGKYWPRLFEIRLIPE